MILLPFLIIIRITCITETFASSTAAFDCAIFARNHSFNSSQIAHLCSGATSNNPVFCATAAQAENHFDPVGICSGAISNAPITCFNAAREKGYQPTDAEALCYRATSISPVNCAEEAVTKLYTRNQAAELCAGADSTAPVICASEATSPNGFSKDQAIQLCKTYQNTPISNFMR